MYAENFAGKGKSEVFQTTSKAGTLRRVEVIVGYGQVSGTFVRQRLMGKAEVKTNVPLKGDILRLRRFAAQQPGMFCKWVDSKIDRESK